MKILYTLMKYTRIHPRKICWIRRHGVLQAKYCFLNMFVVTCMSFPLFILVLNARTELSTPIMGFLFKKNTLILIIRTIFERFQYSTPSVHPF